MKLRHWIAMPMIGLALAGCVNKDLYSGNVYEGSQSKEVRSISYGTLLSARNVTIQPKNENVLGTIGGGAIGGILGSTIGNGSGQALSTAIGAVLGTITGNQLEQKTSQVESQELVIRKDDGKEIVVVQKSNPRLVVGAKVRIVSGGGAVNVSAI